MRGARSVPDSCAHDSSTGRAQGTSAPSSMRREGIVPGDPDATTNDSRPTRSRVRPWMAQGWMGSVLSHEKRPRRMQVEGQSIASNHKTQHRRQKFSARPRSGIRFRPAQQPPPPRLGVAVPAGTGGLVLLSRQGPDGRRWQARRGQRGSDLHFVRAHRRSHVGINTHESDAPWAQPKGSARARPKLDRFCPTRTSPDLSGLFALCASSS